MLQALLAHLTHPAPSLPPTLPNVSQTNSPQLQPLRSSTIKITTSVEQPATWKNATIKRVPDEARRKMAAEQRGSNIRTQHIKSIVSGGEIRKNKNGVLTNPELKSKLDTFKCNT